MFHGRVVDSKEVYGSIGVGGVTPSLVLRARGTETQLRTGGRPRGPVANGSSMVGGSVTDDGGSGSFG